MSNSTSAMSKAGIHTQYITADGLRIRFARSERRDDQVLLLSPWWNGGYTKTTVDSERGVLR
jgi:hypothetical protein